MANFPNLLGIRFCIDIHRKIIIIIYIYTYFKGNTLISNCYMSFLQWGYLMWRTYSLLQWTAFVPRALQTYHDVHRVSKMELHSARKSTSKGPRNSGSSRIMLDPWMNNEKKKLNNLIDFHYYYNMPRVQEPWATNVRPDCGLILDYL